MFLTHTRKDSNLNLTSITCTASKILVLLTFDRLVAFKTIRAIIKLIRIILNKKRVAAHPINY